jgi:hypothetical protein
MAVSSSAFTLCLLQASFIAGVFPWIPRPFFLLLLASCFPRIACADDRVTAAAGRDPVRA